MADVSSRLLQLPVSAVRKLTPYAAAAKKEGVKVYHLNIGDPDIKTPDVMMKALHTFSINPIRYADSRGEGVLLSALETYYHDLGYSFVSKDQMIISVGGSEALTFAFFSIASAGDEVLVFEPFYSNYQTASFFVDVHLKAVPTSAKNGFHLPDKKTIESHITNKTKAILITTPGNPTGTVYTKEEMEMLVDIAKKHNLFLISDEVYREFVYDQKHVSLLSYMKEIPEYAILLDSLSKRYSLCGARIGIMLSLNTELISGSVKLAQSRLSGGIIDQIVASKLTAVPQEYLLEVKKEYQKRRDVIYEGFSAIPGVSLTQPEGAFYSMVTLPVVDAEDFCIFLLNEYRLNNETVMLAPGGGFYQSLQLGKNQVRIAYVLCEEDLKRSIEIIKKALVVYTSKQKTS